MNNTLVNVERHGKSILFPQHWVESQWPPQFSMPNLKRGQGVAYWGVHHY